MWTLIIRTLLMYTLIVIAMRVMGKKQLGELQPSELVTTILISNMASISIETTELPLFNSIIPVFLLVALEILLSALCVRSRKLERLVSGTPRVVIRDGEIEQETLLELRFTIDDLLAALRDKDVFDINEVSFAMLETNGRLTVQKKFENETPTNRDFDFLPPKATQPSLPVIIDGQFCIPNLEYFSLEKQWVLAQCAQENCTLQDVFLFLCNDAKETQLIKKAPTHQPVL